MPGEVGRNDAAQDRATDSARLVPAGHCKSIAAPEIRAMLPARKLLQTAARPRLTACAGFLRGFGLEGRQDHADNFAGRIESFGGPSKPSDDRACAASRGPFCLQVQRV